jgi:hypothetical protein
MMDVRIGFNSVFLFSPLALAMGDEAPTYFRNDYSSHKKQQRPLTIGCKGFILCRTLRICHLTFLMRSGGV